MDNKIFLQVLVENYLKSLGWKCIENNFSDKGEIEIVMKRTDGSLRFIKLLINQNIKNITSKRVETIKYIKDWLYKSSSNATWGLDLISLKYPKLSLIYISDI